MWECTRIDITMIWKIVNGTHVKSFLFGDGLLQNIVLTLDFIVAKCFYRYAPVLYDQNTHNSGIDFETKFFFFLNNNF